MKPTWGIWQPLVSRRQNFKMLNKVSWPSVSWSVTPTVCLLGQSMEKACTTVLDQSGWAQSEVYIFDRVSVWHLNKVDIAAAAASLAADEPLSLPIKLSAPLTYLNVNSVDALTTALATVLARKPRLTESTSVSQKDILPVSDLETETDEENNNHTGTASLRY